MGCAQSSPCVPMFRSKLSAQEQRNTDTTRKETNETNNKTVPCIVVYVTVTNKEAGKKLAESILKARLAAFVNAVPEVKCYLENRGEIQTYYEELLIIKTKESLLEALTEHVKANLGYTLPEVVALPITGGYTPHVDLIKVRTRD
ncbi:hypothetical protein CDL12_04728 [Handroanthus impetiginosus]|uniref:Uncharacterized protein n=1 Tax=Handroanthus impetiginosus TaxID=429701 RepID=A0A2G9HYH8_9LAMI|nr:hypothetical protein CDL12_04728 [Handroanthus impetiginosus]